MSNWREEIIGDARLILADCMEVLPTLPKVDAVITDPPYGIDYGRHGSFSASHGWGKLREQVEWDVDRPAREVFDLMAASVQKGGSMIVWGGNYFTDYLPPTMQWLVWDKGQRNFSLADCEFAWSSQRRAARVFDYSRSQAMQDGKQHPTQKPVALMAWCIEQAGNPQTILDPFMGSGTTGVAAIQLGRKFIGIEREPRYFEIACERIRRAVDQGRLFEPEAPKAEQAALL